MSIIIRNNIFGTNNNEGFPPGDIYDIKVQSTVSSIGISWMEPEPTIVDNVILSTPDTIILIRKQDSYPTSTDDGTTILIKNIADDTSVRQYYYDENIIDGEEYYYRFFVKSTDDIINDSTSMTCKCNAQLLDPSFGNNTWEQIASASESGIIPEEWQIGDEKSVSLSSPYQGLRITFQIADFGHYDKSDGTGKAGICLVSKHVISKVPMNHSENYSQCRSYPYTYGCTSMNRIYNALPEELQSVIKTVVVPCTCLESEGSEFNVVNNHDFKIFIPSNIETNRAVGNNAMLEGTLLPSFTTNSDRIKTSTDGTTPVDYWTRTVLYSDNNYKYWYVSSLNNGTINGSYNVTEFVGLVPIINI